MKNILLLLSLFVSGIISAQNVNDYKYALVPAKFGIFKTDEYHRLNIIAKMFMQKYGFETYLSSETQPHDFVNTNCNKVFVDLTEENTMFVTKVRVVLKDCNGKVIATSELGTSREKEYQVAYNEAVREAFNSFPALKNHVYVPKVAQSAHEKFIEQEGKEQILQEFAVTASSEKVSSSTLYAQAISNGFQLVDAEPKVVMKIYKTSSKDFYTAVKGELQGALVSKNGAWFFEYYKNDVLVSEKIDVKF